MVEVVGGPYSGRKGLVTERKDGRFLVNLSSIGGIPKRLYLEPSQIRPAVTRGAVR